MAGSPSTPIPSFKDNVVHHMETVFGELQKTLKKLAKNSLTLHLLSPSLHQNIIEGLKTLPQAKQTEAIQILQKEKSSYFRQAQQNHSAQKKALQEIKSIQAEAQKMKQTHFKAKEISHAESTLNRLSQ